MTEPGMWERWCVLNDIQPVPAPPHIVARFIADIAPLGIDKVWPIVEEISRAHYIIGLADPTLGGPVAATISEIAKINPPRSWPKDHKARFSRLPYDLQGYLSRHEEKREKEIRRAQTEAAELRRELAALKPKEKAEAA